MEKLDLQIQARSLAGLLEQYPARIAVGQVIRVSIY